jgi:hypothetical protein
MAMATSLIDVILPKYDANEVHERSLPATPDVVWAALQTTPQSEVRLAGLLMGIRSLPKWFSKGKALQLSPDLPALQALQKAGFVLLGETPQQEVVVGAVAQFWRLTGNVPVRVADRVAFMQFTQPGYARAVMNFRLVPEVGGTRLITETRIVGTDAASTRAFKRYWLLIRLGSGAIRRSWLAAIARRVTALNLASKPAA